jgi:hypothetical protein
MSKPNLKNGSLKIAHINACSLLPKIYLIELEMLNNDIILVSETHLSRDIDIECSTVQFVYSASYFDNKGDF